jgi:O-antigen/teichoic acid export membrane protein
LVARPDEAPRLVGAALVLRIVMIPVFVASALVYGHLAHYRGQASMVLWLAIGATFLTLLADPLQSAFQAKERMEYMALGDVINKSAQGLVGIALVLLGAGAVGLTGSWLVVSGVVVVLSAFWIRPLVRIQMRVHVRDVVRLVRDSLAYFAAGLFYLVYLWIDSVMLSLMTTSTVVGWYAVPTKLFTTMMFVPVIVSTAWLPRLVTAWEQERDDFVEVARKPVELVAILGLPICAGLALVSRWVIPLLYGDAFKESVSVLVILGFTLVPMYCNIMLAQVIVAMKRQVRWTFVMAGATVVNPTFNYFLIRWAEHRYHDGAIGAAISLLLTELLIVVVAMVLVGRVVLNWRSASRVGRAALAAGAMWGVGTLARPLGGFPAAILGSLTFVLLGWLFRIISAEEMEMGKATVRKLLRRSQPSA